MDQIIQDIDIVDRNSQEAMETVLSRKALGRVALVFDEEAKRLKIS